MPAEGCVNSSDALSPSVFVEKACLSFDGTVLFDNLSLHLPGGQWTCLLGPSGVGKTSLLRLIAGLAPAGAHARIRCSDACPLAGRLSWMGQNDLLLPWASVLDNVTLGYRLRKQKPPRTRALHLLEEVGLSAYATSRPASLSGGMRQRAALVRTLLEDRPIILMDEPFSALDVATRLRLQTLFATLLRKRTILLLTHDPLEALRLGHHVHILNGRPATLRRLPTLPACPPHAPDDPALLSLYAATVQHLMAAPMMDGQISEASCG